MKAIGAMTLACLAGCPVAGHAKAEVPPRLAAQPPAWVAPGARVELRATVDRPGVLVLERRVPGGLKPLARTRARPGTPVAIRFRPSDVGTYRLRLRLGDGPARPIRLRIRPITLAAVGDVSPGSAIAALRRYGPAWHWGRVGGWLRSQDLVVANLETAIGTSGPPWPGKAFHFLAPASSVRAASRVGGVDVMSLANNHALDFGRGTFTSGIAAIRRAGVLPFGGGAKTRDALAPAIVERGGLRIAFVGFNAVTPFEFWATTRRAGNAPATRGAVTASVRRAKARADLVVVYFHWGIEYSRHPVAEQRTLAAAALSAGADVVLGAHPHVPQPVERRGRRLVAWSLGNFVFSPGRPPGLRSMALRLTLDARGVRGWSTRPVAIVGTRPTFTR